MSVFDFVYIVMMLGEFETKKTRQHEHELVIKLQCTKMIFFYIKDSSLEK